MLTRAVVRFVEAGLVPGLAAACYTYSPVLATPEPTTQISVILSDYGRLEASRQVGPQADRVEGSVVSASDSGYLLAVSGVKPITGAWVRWTGETVSLRRDYVASVYQRRLSKSRTAVFAAGVAAALTAAVVGFDILGFGQDPVDIVPGAGGDPGDT